MVIWCWGGSFSGKVKLRSSLFYHWGYLVSDRREIINNLELLEACWAAEVFQSRQKAQVRGCNQQPWGEKVFGYASRALKMSEHRYHRGLSVSPCKCGRFLLCFERRHSYIIQSSPLTGSQLCPCQYSVRTAVLFNQSSDYPFQHFEDENDAVD